MKREDSDDLKGPIAPCSGASREGARLQPRVGVAGDVVNLADYRRGTIAAWALVSILHRPPWLQNVYMECDAEGVRIIAIVRDDSSIIRSAFPRFIDYIPVVIRKAQIAGKVRT